MRDNKIESSLGRPNEDYSPVFEQSSNPVVNEEQAQPTWKYLLAWFLMGILHKIYSAIYTAVVFPKAPTGEAELRSLLELSLLIDPLSQLIAIVGIFYLVYFMLFTSLNAKKVLPWLYVLIPIGTLAMIGRTMNEIEPIKNLLPANFTQNYAIFSLLASAVALYIIRKLTLKRGKVTLSPP
jgi:hypothetical protein